MDSRVMNMTDEEAAKLKELEDRYRAGGAPCQTSYDIGFLQGMLFERGKSDFNSGVSSNYRRDFVSSEHCHAHRTMDEDSD